VRRVARALIRTIGGPVTGLAVTVLRLRGQRAGFVLVYHAIADAIQSGEREIVPPHPPRLFAGHLRHLARWYRIVPATNLVEAVAARRRGERFPVAITFDDDLREHVSSALPVLRREGATATFFLCGNALDRPLSFWWQRLQRAVDDGIAEARFLVAARSPIPLEADAGIRRLAYAVEEMAPDERQAVSDELARLAGPDPDEAGLRAADVRDLVAAGMAIGFHTLRHDALTQLGEAQLLDALQAGRGELEAVVGHPLDAIAYPHGRADERVAAGARGAGYRHGFAGEGRPVRPEVDPLLVPRMTPSYRSVGHFGLQLLLALISRR
jgi:peptidoglycan/xylan/chitin deacetylase (PgdA/CDA1 family)